ncbi:hypothetical protein [Oceanobacillus kapialis]|uniref:hypothetical protein n=1 Tax=Oceanobacillus kapialis TaxID=481353 RepID=UPI00384F03E1
MNEALQELAEACQKDFGLENYYLKRYNIFREDNPTIDNDYLFSMEWFPKDTQEVEEDLNPPGTAVVEIELHSKKLRHFSFVQGVNLVEDQIFPQLKDGSETVIEWVEELTGLEFGRQFQLAEETDDGIHLLAAADNIPVFPVGTIDVTFNEDGLLSHFSKDGSFPGEDQIKWEPFALTSAIVDPIILDQMQLLEIPLEEQERWLAVYGTTTTFITNDQQKVIPYEKAEMRDSYSVIDKNIDWENGSVEDTFEAIDIDLSDEVSIEEALAGPPNKNTQPITSGDKEKSFQAVQSFLQQKYPDDNNKWKLHTLSRERGYIIAELRPKVQDKKVIQQKLSLFLDATTYTVLNFTDNHFILEMFSHLEEAESPNLTKDEAFEKLHNHIEVSPVYVYDPVSATYQLCGKVDCSYGVDAATGEVILLDEL